MISYRIGQPLNLFGRRTFAKRVAKSEVARQAVLHAIAGRTLLAHVLTALARAGGTQTAVVVGPDREDRGATWRLGGPPEERHLDAGAEEVAQPRRSSRRSRSDRHETR